MVKAGREKHAANVLEGVGCKCFLPLSKSARRWSDRTKISEVPLFPGYFFCRMDPHNRLPVLMTPGVIQIVGIGKTPVPVNEEEIAAVQRAIESGLSTVPWPHVQVGNVARIEEGPLRGLTGIVIKIKSELKLVLSVSLLQRSVAVEIDSTWIGARVPEKSSLIQDPSIRLSPQAGLFPQRVRAGFLRSSSSQQPG
jgi:transcription antitermination factor NusG